MNDHDPDRNRMRDILRKLGDQALPPPSYDEIVDDQRADMFPIRPPRRDAIRRVPVLIGAAAAVIVGIGTLAMWANRDNRSASDEAPSTSERLGSGDDYSVTGALAELPGSLDPNEAQIVTGDLTAATDALGLQRPTDPHDVEALGDWLRPLTGGPYTGDSAKVTYLPLGVVFGLPSGAGEFHDELGWSVIDADSYVEYTGPSFLGTPPPTPGPFSVIFGPYDDETLRDDLIELEGGVLTNKEGDDEQVDIDVGRTGGSALDPLGRPVHLAQDGERIAWSRQIVRERSATAPLKQWLERPDETLADNDDLAALANALDDADVFSAVLRHGPSQFASSTILDHHAGSGDDELRARLEAELEALPPSPFNAIGIGWNADDNGAVITIAFQHASHDDAAANADALDTLFREGTTHLNQQRLSELYDLESIETDRTVTVVTVRPANGLPSTVFYELGDIPFIHR